MSQKPFHLGWFLQGSSVQAWNYPWTGHIGRTWMKPDLFMDLARSLERSCFDYILLEDSSYIGESFGLSMDIYLENGIAVPRQDPSVIASMMSAVTSRIGIVPTFGTFAYHPYLLARLVGTLDQVSDGRIGWNMVTGSSDYAAMNFGMDGMPEHDTRYDMADEYMAAVKGLWDSWEPGAMVADPETGVLIDPTKVRHVNFEGKHFKTRGPLNSGPCVNGRPVIAQAGGSPRGRKFAALHADTIVASAKGPDRMKAYREDVRGHMVAQGRDPDSCKVLFLASPLIGETEADVAERQRIFAERREQELPQKLAFYSKITNIDFSALDLDAPVGELTTNGHQSYLDTLRETSKGKTLRQALMGPDLLEGSVPLMGTVDQVAGQMAEVMQEVGGDGFLISMPNVSRRTLAEFEDGLIPELQRRGLVRKAYEQKYLRDTLLEF